MKKQERNSEGNKTRIKYKNARLVELYEHFQKSPCTLCCVEISIKMGNVVVMVEKKIQLNQEIQLFWDNALQLKCKHTQREAERKRKIESS